MQSREEGTLMEETIRFGLNGKSVSITADSSSKLLWVLRTNFGLTGASS